MGEIKINQNDISSCRILCLFVQQPNYDVCDGQDKFFNPLSVYNMGQNILNGILGPSSGRAGFGGVTVNTQFQNFGNFNGNVNTGVISGGSQRINYGGVQSGRFGNQATSGGNQAISMFGTQ